MYFCEYTYTVHHEMCDDDGFKCELLKSKHHTDFDHVKKLHFKLLQHFCQYNRLKRDKLKDIHEKEILEIGPTHEPREISQAFFYSLFYSAQD